MKKVILLIALAISANLSYGQANKSYNATVKKMLTAAGTEETFKAVIKQMFGMFRQQMHNVPDSVMNDLENEFSMTSVDDLVDMLSPVYEKYLTQSDLEKLIDFYHTPVGKKYAEKTPLIMQESMQVGQEWGMKVGQKFQEKLKQKGY